MISLTERKLVLYFTAELHDTLLKIAQKNKLSNLQKNRKGKDKFPDSVTSLIRIACEEKYLKKK